MAVSHSYVLLLLLAATLPPFGWSSAPSYDGGHALYYNGTREWGLQKFSTLISFGDSYSDTGRFLSYIQNPGKPPPLGWQGTLGNAFGFDADAWPTYVGWYTDARVNNYAVDGAACLNDITPRYLGNISYPDVEHYEIPAYIADSQYVQADGTRYLVVPPQRDGALFVDRHERLGCWRLPHGLASSRHQPHDLHGLRLRSASTSLRERREVLCAAELDTSLPDSASCHSWERRCEVEPVLTGQAQQSHCDQLQDVGDGGGHQRHLQVPHAV